MRAYGDCLPSGRGQALLRRARGQRWSLTNRHRWMMGIRLLCPRWRPADLISIRSTWKWCSMVQSTCFGGTVRWDRHPPNWPVDHATGFDPGAHGDCSLNEQLVVDYSLAYLFERVPVWFARDWLHHTCDWRQIGNFI